MLGQKIESQSPHSPPSIEVVSAEHLAAVTILPAMEVVPPSTEILPANAQVIITTEGATILPGTTLMSVRDSNSNDIR